MIKDISKGLDKLTRLYWTDWKQVAPEQVDREVTRERERLNCWLPVLTKVKKLGSPFGAALYYPGAGLDLAAALATELREIFLVDPRYFQSSGNGLSSLDLRRMLKCFDPRAQFTSISGRVAQGRLMMNGMKFTVWLVGASNYEACKLIPGILSSRSIETVYMTKCSLHDEVVFPPAFVSNLRPRVFVIDIPTIIPCLEARGRRHYKHRLFSASLGGHQRVEVFRSYRCSRSNLSTHSTQTNRSPTRLPCFRHVG